MNEPKLKNFVIIGQFSDDVYRQFFVDEKTQRSIYNLIPLMDKDNQVKVLDKPVEGISWESPVNLSK